MNRREFAKAAGLTTIVPLYMTGHTEDSSSIDDDTFVSSLHDEFSGTHVMDFPDRIVAMTNFRDKVLVACEYSLWEVWTDHSGQLVRSQISSRGMSS